MASELINFLYCLLITLYTSIQIHFTYKTFLVKYYKLSIYYRSSMCFLALSRNSDLRRLLSPSVSPYKLTVLRSNILEYKELAGKGAGDKGGGVVRGRGGEGFVVFVC